MAAAPAPAPAATSPPMSPRACSRARASTAGRAPRRPGLAYTVPVIAEAAADGHGGLRTTAFRGEVLLPDDTTGALLTAALRRVDHLGGGGSRGLGAVP